ncbi:glucose-6-phosphate 1-epimerase [Coprinopsis marcescibilis]|uniref:Glucose-6-phosphate 1-epimerase n=1 Tax=Coprinopsis marcescibilis TaxID=230819 RepID=A0A5C3LCG9_COPMA|nr:glucose-6-phosphate 1-epimerase [Coprinopsis marcescibilis]
MPVHHLPGKLILQHPEGPSAEVLLYGATVVSWKSPSHGSTELKERLFLSSKAILDGSKAVRGGIPVVFPCFGAPQHPDHMKLSQHGFARTSTWKFHKTVLDNGVGVSIQLDLHPTPEIAKVYNKPFQLSYVVTLAGHQLSTDLHVTNPAGSDASLEFQALLHTYLAAPASEVGITPLENLKFYDKTEASEEARQTAKVETRSVVDVGNYTDSVYEDAPQNYMVSWGSGSINVRAKGFKDVVVWNPGEEGKKIGDMEDGGWNKYVCVEPGHVRGYLELAPGHSWIGQQVITVKA